MRHIIGIVATFATIGATASWASAPSTSLRPIARVAATTPEPAPPTHTATRGLAVERSIRPEARGRVPARATQTAPAIQTNPAGFTRWMRDFRPKALRAGISGRVFDAAFARAEFLPRIVELDQNQSEFTKQLWEYLDSAVSDSRVRNGKRYFNENRRTLQAIERRYGVRAEIVAAVWGLESAYGSMRGNTSVISAMATLAYEGRRRGYFETELIAALKILQSGDTVPARMTGSWAGAMGHTQFMPTSYLAHAVDATGDGKRNIWDDSPADALASTANYLRASGWTTGQPWGIEVTLPRGFNYGQTGERTKRRVSHWNSQGVRLTNGRQIPDHGRSSILVPAGSRGAAFVIFDNFHVIEKYNPADAYVIGVGHLADRIAGGPAIRAAWPRSDRALSRSEKIELQHSLTRAGFSPGKFDGIIGPNTIDAVRRYQASIGQIPDGYASLTLLQRLR